MRKNKAYQANRKPTISWYVTGQKAATCLRALLPYLLDKKPQAALCLQFLEEQKVLLHGGPRFNRWAGEKYDNATVTRFNGFVTSIKALKRAPDAEVLH
jgi:hypothetical protein